MTDTATIRATLAAAGEVATQLVWLTSTEPSENLSRLLSGWVAGNLTFVESSEVRDAILALVGNTPTWLQQLCDQVDAGVLPAGVREEYTIIGHPGWPGCAPHYDTLAEAQSFIERNPARTPAVQAGIRIVRRYISDWAPVVAPEGDAS